ncbi:MAG: T9SS type A sorting domain-containing protein [Paludibacter sp.]|nr:T9SS type A sorting domain-containing protein [Paludibacter sp.]
MKKLLFTLFFGLYGIPVIFGQITIYDGETVTADFWDIGGGFVDGEYTEGPNGADCHQGEGWKLYVSGKMDILSGDINNPDSTGENTTSKVIRLIRNPNGEGWAGAYWDISSYNIDISTKNHFSLLIKKTIAGNVTMKLEGAGSQEVTTYYTTPNEWQQLDFYFDATNFSGSPTTLFVFPHNQTDLSENIITYFDEISVYDGTTANVIFDGSDDSSLNLLDGYWSPNGDLNNLETDLFPNLYQDKINSSNHVIRFLRAMDGYNWCGLGINDLDIDLSVTPVISLMINKSIAGTVGLELDGAGTKELFAEYTTPGQWQRLTFKFKSSDFTGNPTTMIIHPHYEETDQTNLNYHTPIYIDNILLRDTVTFPTDYFRSVSSGNWNSTSTWESSYNNQDWIESETVPNNQATEIHISTGNLVTIPSNCTASELYIDAGGKLTVNETESLSCDSLYILSDATSGTATFINNGTANINSAKVNQYLTYRSWYMSSPVSESYALSETDLIKYYDETTNTWKSSSTLEPGKGYIVNPTNDGDESLSFCGTLNDGDQSISLTYTNGVNKAGFNLIGNPYPSYLKWTDVYNANQSFLSTSTMWYRTKYNGIYYFWTVNGASGETIGDEASQYIPPMQAFWVRASASGNLTLTNTMRSHAPSSNFLLKAPQLQSSGKISVRLVVSNGTNSDEALIYTNSQASDGYDIYDSPKMSNENSKIPEIYTEVTGQHLAINGMQQIPLDQDITLGLVEGESTELTVKASELNNISDGCKVILKDKLLDIETELADTNTTYDFVPVTDAPDRFSVIFKTSGTVTRTKTLNNKMFAFSNKGQITIVDNTDLDITEFEIYNALGRKITTQIKTGNQITVDTVFPTGIYFIHYGNNVLKVIVK